MKAEDLKDTIEFAGGAREILMGLLEPMLEDRLTDQPVEAVAVYLANIRWATYEALEALSRLERTAETALPLWADPADVNILPPVEDYICEEDLETLRKQGAQI
jgi:hypothetical protein